MEEAADPGLVEQLAAALRAQADDLSLYAGLLMNLATGAQNVELPLFTQAFYDARELAMARMQAEAESLAAERIVSVQLYQRNHSWGAHTTEFMAIGTAVAPYRDDHTIDRPQLVLGLDR